MPKNIQKNKKVYKNSKKTDKNNFFKINKSNEKNYENNTNEIESFYEIEYLENDSIINENPDNLSIEELLKKEFKNIIRICDICGNEMNLDIDSENYEIFICNSCGYKIRLTNSSL